MGIAERKDRQRAELREQILSAARRIVLDEGFDALTMRKIGDAIEYSPATIYLYFENREAIGRQLCSESFEHLIAYMAPVGQIADPYERLRGIGRSYTRFGFENPEEYRLLFMTDSAFMEAIFPPDHAADPKDPGERAFQFVVDAFRAAQAAGVIRPDGDPVALAEMVWTACRCRVDDADLQPRAGDAARGDRRHALRYDAARAGRARHIRGAHRVLDARFFLPFH